MENVHKIIDCISTRSQAVARIADRTATQQTRVICDCC